MKSQIQAFVVRTCVCGLLTFLIAGTAFATTYQTTRSGDWTATGDAYIWNTGDHSTYPTGTDAGIKINSGHAVTLDTAVQIKNFNLNSGGSLDVSAGGLTSYGNESWNISDGGLFLMSGGSLVIDASTGLGLPAGSSDAVRFRMSGGALVTVKSGVNLNGGTFEVNGGSFGKTMRFHIPSSAGGNGRLLFKDVKMAPQFKYFYLGCNDNGTLSGATGTVAVVNATVAFTNCYDVYRFPDQGMANCSATIDVDGGRAWFPNYTSTKPSLKLSNALDADNGSRILLDIRNKSTVLVGGAFDAAAFADDTIWDSFAPSKRNYNDLYIYNGATVRVSDGSTLKVMRQLYGGPGGRLVIDGGTVQCFYFGTTCPKTTAYSTPYVVDMTDGVLCATDGSSGAALKIGGDSYDATNDSNMGPVVFNQAGGIVSNATKSVKIGIGSAQNVVRYNVSGGSFDPGTTVSAGSAFTELRFKGSAYDGQLAILSAKNALVEYVLDKSPAHIKKVYVSGQKAYVTGNLRVALDGGVLLTEETSFLLLEKKSGTGRDLTYNDTQAYDSQPDGVLWTTALDAAKLKVTATMSEPIGTVAANESSLALPQAVSRGSVALTGLKTGEDLKVAMKVRTAAGGEPTAGELESLVAGLVQAGYTNSTAASSSEYNLTAVIPGEFVTSSSERFAWDFTVNSVRDIAEGREAETKASVAGFSVTSGEIERGFYIFIR